MSSRCSILAARPRPTPPSAWEETGGVLRVGVSVFVCVFVFNLVHWFGSSDLGDFRHLGQCVFPGSQDESIFNQGFQTVN